MATAHILVADDESGPRGLLRQLLAREGYEVAAVEDGEQALELLRERHFDLVITDLVMPRVDGLELLREVQRSGDATVCMAVTAHGSIESAIEAMRAGAFDYLTKPFTRNALLLQVERALEYGKLQSENRHLRREVRDKYKFANLIGDSPAMQRIYRIVGKVADSDATVLIEGESGTGKELLARAIHYNSRRADRPLVPINCGAIPKDLLESELFGHVKGAFTGATTSRAGRFELADGGTLFLDEVGEMSPDLQVKILRVLQEQEFERVGGTKTLHVDVRIIAATNKELEREVEAGRFREDLYYRLNVVPITVPPLRERSGDIPLLIHHFLEIQNERRGSRCRFTEEAIQALSNYPYPGNVRELENLVERLVVLADDPVIGVEELPPKIRNTPPHAATLPMNLPPEGLVLKEVLEELEHRLIDQALEMSGGVKSKAAKLLGLNRTTLVEKLRKRGLLEEEAKRPAPAPPAG
ncbi:MAG: sigma-54-dependent Fis family transcriptional regulator [Nitrospirae bacterium]|nr:MAG: sigma-54-dependent Fis family transcriptional regulator [Nitrospirota bacterium]